MAKDEPIKKYTLIEKMYFPIFVAAVIAASVILIGSIVS